MAIVGQLKFEPFLVSKSSSFRFNVTFAVILKSLSLIIFRLPLINERRINKLRASKRSIPFLETARGKMLKEGERFVTRIYNGVKVEFQWKSPRRDPVSPRIAYKYWRYFGIIWISREAAFISVARRGWTGVRARATFYDILINELRLRSTILVRLFVIRY